MALEVTVVVPVRWRDMDPLGHVNNAVYLNFLEEARDGLLREALGEGWFDTVSARIEIDFRHEIRLGTEHISVTSRLEGFGRSSLRSRETIRLPDGTIAAEAVTVTVTRDADARGSRPLTSSEREHLERMLAD